MKQYKSFVYDTGLIAIATALNNLKGIVLVPLITKLLLPADYGAWTQLKITVTLLIPFLTLGSGQAITKFLAGKQDKESIRNDFLSCLFIVLFLGCFLIALSFIFSNNISIWVFNSKKYTFFAKIIPMLLLLESVNALFFEFFRAFRHIKIYFNILLLETICELLLIVYAVVSGYGIFGACLGLVATRFIFVMLRSAQIYRLLGFAFPKFDNYKKYFFFGIPLVFSNFLFFVVCWSNRYFINYFLGLSEVGIFSVAYFLAYTIVLIDTPIGYMLFPTVSDLVNRSQKVQAAVYVNYSLKYFIIFGTTIFFVTLFFTKELLMLFATKNFLSAQTSLPLLSLGLLIFQAGVIAEYVLMVFNRNMLVLRIYMLLAIVNIVLNILFIPKLGIFGAALAVLISSIIYSFFNLAACQKYIRCRIELTMLSKIVLSAAASSFIFFIILKNIWRMNMLILLLANLAAYFAILKFLKCFTPNELSLFRSFFLRDHNNGREKI